MPLPAPPSRAAAPRKAHSVGARRGVDDASRLARAAAMLEGRESDVPADVSDDVLFSGASFAAAWAVGGGGGEEEVLGIGKARKGGSSGGGGGGGGGGGSGAAPGGARSGERAGVPRTRLRVAEVILAELTEAGVAVRLPPGGGTGRLSLSAAMPAFAASVSSAGASLAGSGAAQYVAASLAPTAPPPRRHHCDVCGYASKYGCARCGTRICGAACGTQHSETRCSGGGGRAPR